MNLEIKEKLERLKKDNKVKIAKNQLIDNLYNWYKIDISNDLFIGYQISENIHKCVYEKLRSDYIKIDKFHYDYDITNKKLDLILNKFENVENERILFYPSTFGFYFRSGSHLYLDFPLALISSIKSCRENVFKLIHDIHDDLIIVEENLKYGIVISIDEYQDLSIEYWGN